MPVRIRTRIALDDALAECGLCRQTHTPDELARHREQLLTEIEHTQTRTLTPLPATAWPLGRPWKETR